MKAIIIVNPLSGQGRGLEIAGKVEKYVQANGWSAILHVTQASTPGREKSATALTKRYCAGADRVVVVGGDGTLREVVLGLAQIEKGVPVAVVPLGNANVIAQEFGIPSGVNASIELVIGVRTIGVDAARVNDEVFLAMVGVGYDAWVTRIVQAIRKTRLGAKLYASAMGADILYAAAGLISAGRFFPQQFTLTLDAGDTSRVFPTIWVCNTHFYAKSWSITPNANAADGELNYHGCKRAGFIRPLIALYQARKRQHAPAWISEYGSAKNVRIDSRKPFCWQMDGDPQFPTQSLNIEILPDFFNLVIPNNFQPAYFNKSPRMRVG